MRGVAAWVLAVMVSSCSSGAGSEASPNDAAVETDARAVVVVDCATSSPATTITAVGAGEAGVYDPSSAGVSAGDVVRFVMPTDHDVAPDLGTDAALSVDFGETKCFRFDVAATYEFHCSVHGFRGSVLVRGR